ncbi:MAG TPA: hypothetical protein VEO95_13575 [Chthoniobacteraceae bacterium]|nr:hypothetical protein [Chthoniobacteraceae bacterium]
MYRHLTANVEFGGRLRYGDLLSRAPAFALEASTSQRLFMQMGAFMPTIAFWNLAKKSHLPMLVEFIEENGVEILLVAEQEFSPAELMLAHAQSTSRSLYSADIIDSRVRFYSLFPSDRFHPVADDGHVSIKEYRPLVGSTLLIVGVHLASKLFQREFDQPTEARRLMKRIEEAETLVGHERTIVLGDFNMNPFEPGMVDSDGLHGVMDRRIAAKLARTVNGQSRRYFYNPMWKLMGNNSAEALGTYFRGGGSYVHYFWHTFDQVLLRPSLLESFREEELRVVESIGVRSLLATNPPGIDRRISDHLPIVFKLNTRI